MTIKKKNGAGGHLQNYLSENGQYCGKNIPTDSHFVNNQKRKTYEKAIKEQEKQTLINELLKKDTKINTERVMFITKDRFNCVVWLEIGNETAGFSHIVFKHKEDFLNKGIELREIPNLLESLIESGKIVGFRNNEPNSPIYETKNKLNKTVTIVIIIGDNGFIVTAYPYDF